MSARNPPIPPKPPMRSTPNRTQPTVRKPAPAAATPCLKLFRGDPCPDEPVDVYKFPDITERKDRQGRLVAGRVGPRPFGDRAGAEPGPTLCESSHADCVCKITTSDSLIREIESTLDRMQHRLNDFRQQVDDAFKFPEPNDDPDRPRAA